MGGRKRHARFGSIRSDRIAQDGAGRPRQRGAARAPSLGRCLVRESSGGLPGVKALGLSLAEIKELNAVYAIAGSTQAMLQRLDGVLGPPATQTTVTIVATVGELS